MRKALARLILPFLVFEDILVFVEGGDSYLGRRIEMEIENAAHRRGLRAHRPSNVNSLASALRGLLAAVDDMMHIDTAGKGQPQKARLTQAMRLAREALERLNREKTE